MTQPGDSIRDTIRRVADQNEAVRDAARRAASEAAQRADADAEKREGTDIGPDTQPDA